MLTLPRSVVKNFRSVARRAVPSGRPRGPAPPVRILTEKGVITLAVHLVDVVVSLQTLGDPSHSGSMILYMNDLERFEGSGSELVTLETTSRDCGRASWQVRDIPAATEFKLAETNLEWPEIPKQMTLMSATFTQAMHEAGLSSSVERGKYALDRIQIRGNYGQIIGADVHHFMVQGGFTFPFAEELLVPAVPVFGAKELARQSDVSVGFEQNWLLVEAGPWRIWLRHDTECRYPNVFDAMPRAPGASVLFDEYDVETLLEVIATLPREMDGAQPVTLDLAEQVAVRVRPNEQGDVIEIPLSKTERVGPDMQLVLNREHFGRALLLGFREFRVSNPERPIVARDEQRVFVSMLLDPRSALQRAKRTTKAMVPVGALSSTEISSPSRSSPLPNRRLTVPVRETPSPERNGIAEVPADASFDPLVEAEALRAALTDAAARVTRLLGWLKHFRKERRALATAYSSLRQLNLSP